MTTIAYCNGEMACDSAHTSHDELVEASLTKVVRLSSGGLLGGAGDSYDQELVALFDKVKKPSQFPTKKQLMELGLDYDGILVLPNGKVYRVVAHPKKPSLNCVDECNRGVAAAGSGAHLAIGNMMATASAKEAVRVACSWDPHSRLPVHTLELRLKRRVKRLCAN